MFIPTPLDLAGKRLVLQTQRLIDGTGAAPKQDMTVVVEGDHITQVIETEAFQEGSEDIVIDTATGGTVMPGIIDSHVHTLGSGEPADAAFSSISTTIPAMALESLKNAWADLEYGITTLRDLGSKGYADVAVRDAIAEGKFPGPRMFVAGQGITMFGGHGDKGHRPEVAFTDRTGLANTIDEAKRAARFQVSRGVDVIKLMTSESRMQRDGSIFWPQEMDYEMIRTAVVEAEKVGIHTAAHCHGGQGVTDTIRAGVRSLEHAHWLTDEQLDLMCEHGTYLCPTFSCNAVLQRRGLEGTGWPAWRMEWLERVIEDKADTFERALKAGVKIVSGSDAATNFNYHGLCVEELAFMVDAGMKPTDVIVAATSRAAELLGMEQFIGSIKEGMLADLILVDGNPLDDMRVFVEKDNVKLVVKDGVPLVDRMGLGDRLNLD